MLSTLELLLFIFLVIGSLGNFFWHHKHLDATFFYTTMVWWGFLTSIYLVILEIQLQSYYFFVPLGLFILFFISYRKDKRKLIHGFFFNICFFSFFLYVSYLWKQTSNFFMGMILLLCGGIVLAGLLFGIYSLIFFLYWHGVQVKKISVATRNILILVWGCYIIFYILIRKFTEYSTLNGIDIIFCIIPAIMIYFFFVFYNFLTASLLYQCYRPSYNQDYIIVLGAGLLGGNRVSPLLAQRIDKAIDFYHIQKQCISKSPKIIMSGGRGTDELLSEAVAMKNYAIAKGIIVDDILIETKSTTTLENMRFAKEIIEQYETKPYRVIFTSSNYHIFRAALCAKAVNLNADGIGSKTATYYLPNAFLREFFAVVVVRRKQHLIICSLIILTFIVFAVIQLIVPNVLSRIA